MDGSRILRVLNAAHLLRSRAAGRRLVAARLVVGQAMAL